MPATKDNQVKDVVTGLALGTLANGVLGLPSQKMNIEFAFTSAWWDWNRKGEFAAIRGHDPGNLFWIGIGKSQRRQGVCAAWEAERWVQPFVLYKSWTVDECLDLVADERASAADWRELGRLFVAEFQPQELLLADPR